MTPAGEYRRGLERHLSQTRDHAKRVDRRAKQLGYGRSLPQLGVSIAETLAGQALALSKAPLDLLDAYERRHQNRKTVLDRIAGLRADEPWPGYDELTVDEIREVLSEADDSTAKLVVEYERRHKHRQGVLEAVKRELAHH